LLRIGEVAGLSGVGVEALRFYEKSGLIEPSARSDSGYRLYEPAVLDRLAFIKKAQIVGFNLAEIARIIADARDGRQPCAEVRKLAATKLVELDRRLSELKRYRRDLKETVEAWNRIGAKEGVICGLIEGITADRRALLEAVGPARHPAPRRRRASRRPR
jgi:MerR family Zn(II)-responsive transcriptional regulator of zntA